MTAAADARRTVITTIFGTMATQALGAAARLGLADHIGDTEAGTADLAAACGVPAEQLSRLLRTLASLGLCTERTPDRFALTEAGALLRRDHPESLLDFTQLMTHEVFQRNWVNLDQSLRDGEPAFDTEYGEPVFTYMSGRPDLAALFHRAMSRRHLHPEMAEAISAAYDLSRFGTVADIGGGDGTMLAALLERHPHLTGTVFDTEAGVARARETIASSTLDNRCTAVAGDFFTEVPKGADLYLVKNVVLNWDDEHAARILRCCRAAMPEHGRLLIVEAVLPDTAGTLNHAAFENPYLTDLHMLVTIGGRNRTRAEHTALCAQAGLRVTGSVPLAQEINASVIEAVPDTA
ncbi:methyltransferase [Actinosynnema sp. ALI-1.44]|uniref:methyltransferase n=1 Tax=Actinosynnema sp. ALI-1.44 TaxID=1933779 RepID=UPI00097C0B85|nr:methyltransferase [Actinosynnema sp. ALI-1.44]ONI78036.1 methyltransferase [Actinosynnema sp. ALI-1.44]